MNIKNHDIFFYWKLEYCINSKNYRDQYLWCSLQIPILTTMIHWMNLTVIHSVQLLLIYFYFSPQIIIQIYYMMIPHCICTWYNKNIRQNRRQLSSTFILSLIQKDSQILSTKYFKFYNLQASTITTSSNLKQREYHFLSGWIPLLVHTSLSILSHSI